MTELSKIAASHLTRQAIVYLRQSSPSQVEHNRESTVRQYALAIKARELGWHLLVSETTSVYDAHNFALAGFEACEPEQKWAGEAQYFVKHLVTHQAA